MNQLVSTIKHGFSNSALRMPYSYSILACGHNVSGELPIGQTVDCSRCDSEAKSLAEIIAFAKTPAFSHLVLRDLTASHTGEWMSYLAYEKDPMSPTQCKLALSVEANKRTEKALKEAGIHAYTGPQHGSR